MCPPCLRLHGIVLYIRRKRNSVKREECDIIIVKNCGSLANVCCVWSGEWEKRFTKKKTKVNTLECISNSFGNIHIVALI